MMNPLALVRVARAERRLKAAWDVVLTHDPTEDTPESLKANLDYSYACDVYADAVVATNNAKVMRHSLRVLNELQEQADARVDPETLTLIRSLTEEEIVAVLTELRTQAEQEINQS